MRPIVTRGHPSSALLWGEVDLHPAFMAMDPIDSGRYWILAAWLPFWALNIIGEEFLWRSVVLPRQEVAFGHWAWLANGVGWLIFHLSFGATILLTLWPIVLVRRFLWTSCDRAEKEHLPFGILPSPRRLRRRPERASCPLSNAVRLRRPHILQWPQAAITAKQKQFGRRDGRSPALKRHRPRPASRQGRAHKATAGPRCWVASRRSRGRTARSKAF